MKRSESSLFFWVLAAVFFLGLCAVGLWIVKTSETGPKSFSSPALKARQAYQEEYVSQGLGSPKPSGNPLNLFYQREVEVTDVDETDPLKTVITARTSEEAEKYIPAYDVVTVEGPDYRAEHDGVIYRLECIATAYEEGPPGADERNLPLRFYYPDGKPVPESVVIVVLITVQLKPVEDQLVKI